jgi:hypothetical protein
MFRSFLNYIRYRKLIEKNRDELVKDFDIKIDRLFRLGSRVSLPESRYRILREYKNPELDIYKSLDEEAKKVIYKLDRYFMQKNLVEYIGIYSAERVQENLVILIMSYRLFDVVKFANTTRVLYLISLLSLFVGFYNIWYMIPGAALILILFLVNFILFKKLFV